MDIKKIALFLGLTFLINWTGAAVFYLMGGEWDQPYALVFAIGYMFVPMVCAIIVQKYVYKEDLRVPLGISWKLNPWWLVGWFLPLVFAIATFGVSLLFPGISYSPEMAGIMEMLAEFLTPEQLEEMQAQLPVPPFWLVLAQSMIAGATINAIPAFGEELGWRGFLLKELIPLGFWKYSLVIGAIWGVWHAPIILMGHNYPGYPLIGVIMMVTWCILLSPMFSYVTLKSGSVITAAIMHGTLNASYGLSIMFVKGGSVLTVGITGLAGFIALIIINLIIYFGDRSLTRGNTDLYQQVT